MEQYYEKKMNCRQNKRRIAKQESVNVDLKTELSLMFTAFYEAHELYEIEIIKTPPDARVRGLEASLLNSKMIQCMQKYFPKNWRFGKYKRFILQCKGYNILFKKLDKYNKPMNIKTMSVQAISCQLSLPLFNETNCVDDPILFFGYKRDKLGNITEPSLVYLDENRVQWIINANDVKIDKSIEIPRSVQTIATPILKTGKNSAKKIG